MIINALGISITTFVGQNYGAGRLDRVKRSVYVCLGISCIITVGLEHDSVSDGRLYLSVVHNGCGGNRDRHEDSSLPGAGICDIPLY